MASSVPPVPPPVPSGPQTNVGLAPNVAGLLCYVPCCIGLIFAIVVAIVEKQSRFVRFHAFQSLLLHGIFIGVWFVIMAATIGLAFMGGGILGLILWPVRVLIGLGGLALCIILMIKANANEEFQLPVIGEMAKKWSA